MMRLLFQYLLIAIILPLCCFAEEEVSANKAQSHILYLMHTGDTEKALQEYEEYRIANGVHDFELIERIGLILLDQGYRTREPETQLLTIFGAGVSTNEKSLYIIEEGLKSSQPQLELIALNFLSRYQNDRADQMLHRAMASNLLIVRLEAAFQLATKKDPKAVGQTEALMSKVDERIWPVFPQLFALIGTPEAKKILRKMLNHPSELVRIAAIVSIAENGHDDFLPVIRRLSSHHEVGQKEACAAALSHLRDEASADRLLALAQNHNVSVKLAALNALYELGREEVRELVVAVAKMKHLEAITLLGKMPGSEDFLASLLTDSNVQVRVNAGIALLELSDPRCLTLVAGLLLKDARDIALLKTESAGKSLHSWRIVPSATQNLDEESVALELSLSLREDLLIKSVELPEREFISLANAILDTQQNDLVPALIDVLENHPTQAVIELLKRHQQKVGAPLIRNYCNLALYRLHQEGPYGDILREWVTQQRNVDLIRFRPLLPWDMRDKSTTTFQLTPQETSRLLVEAFEAFVSTQDDKGVDMLISIIQNGNPNNKYALIGLLMRAIQ